MFLRDHHRYSNTVLGRATIIFRLRLIRSTLLMYVAEAHVENHAFPQDARTWLLDFYTRVFPQDDLTWRLVFYTRVFPQDVRTWRLAF